jgi:hypothetical protein
MEHKHIYDAEGNQLCCTQEKKIYLNVGVKHNEFSITIKFSEMIVHIHPYIMNDKLADIGKENLWFL